MDLVGATPAFPRYTTQLINLANQNAQGTRPKVVGQNVGLDPAVSREDLRGLDDVVHEAAPSAIEEDATARIMTMLDNLVRRSP